MIAIAMSEIIPGKLYLGSMHDATELSWLKSHGITDVITVAILNDEDLVGISDLLVQAKFNHHYFPAYDITAQNLDELFPAIFAIIDSSGTPIPKPKVVLVHCMMGISRSATIVLAYLMYSRKMRLDDATRHVLQQRLCIFPNDGFIRQLIKYEHKLFGSMSLSEALTGPSEARTSFLPDYDGLCKYKRLIHNFSTDSFRQIMDAAKNK
jgi:protein-tyrosine phosphatase